MDPLHQQILDGLAGELNPQVFEDCAADLLRDTFPSLVPVRGGHDAGMDGAIADGEGEAFPLICTTRQDFKRNLVESLDSYVRQGGRRRKAVFATCREITPEARRRLEEAARERGFILVQAVDRQGMAQRLHWSPRWLKDLLGLSAAPSALSAVPWSRRPLIDLELVGREDDLAWLRSTPRDLILAGEPGSGKTFLLLHRIREGWSGLFLVPDRGEVARALVEQRPAAVIVDDSHLRPQVLEMLRHLRSEMDADFSLVATTWTWEKDYEAVAAALPGAEVRKLHPLPRYQILEIFERAGIWVPDDLSRDALLRELVDQAANKPGLAATIAHLWKRGAWDEILNGRALQRDVLAAFGPVGKDVEDLLAAFSLGGDRGMRLEAVQQYLGLSFPEIRGKAAALAAGGVLSEGRDDALLVLPRRLRTSLLRTVFFPDSPPRSQYLSLLDKVPSFAEAIKEIAAVRQAGASVPGICDLVLQAGTGEESARAAWRLLAESSGGEASWVRENYPGDLLDIGSSLLENIPSSVIPRLLDRAAEEVQARERESRAIHLLRAWIQELHPSQTSEALRRRELVARAAKHFLAEGGDLGMGVHAISLALAPNQKWSSRDPGLGTTVKLWSALLPIEGLRRIEDLWVGVKDAIPTLNRPALQHLENALWDWMHPSNAVMGAEVTDEAKREMPAFALRVVRDLVPLAQSSPGLSARLARLAERLGEMLPVELDPVFDLLYPESYVEAEPARQAARQEALGELACEWERLGTDRAIEQLAWYESEAERIGHCWPRGSQEVCRQLAERTADPRPWLEALIECSIGSTFVSPFLDRLVREHREGWIEVADRCLTLDRYRFAAIEAVLKKSDSPPALVARALDRAMEWPEAIEGLALRREIPAQNLLAALRHPSWEVALAAAVGEWYVGKEDGVRAEFLTDWRSAILRAHGTEAHSGFRYWLEIILAEDADLALDWLRARLQDSDLPTCFLGGPFAAAVQALRSEQRAQLIRELPSVPILDSLLPKLVGRDADLYRRLLAREELSEFHLAPLGGKPDEAWTGLALPALGAGYTTERVAEAAIWPAGGHLLSGSGLDYWESWRPAFVWLESHPRSELREVGRQGRKIVEDYILRAQAKEDRIALRGI